MPISRKSLGANIGGAFPVRSPRWSGEAWSPNVSDELLSLDHTKENRGDFGIGDIGDFGDQVSSIPQPRVNVCDCNQ